MVVVVEEAPLSVVDAVVDVVVVIAGFIEIMLAATLACLCLLGPMSGLRGPAAAM